MKKTYLSQAHGQNRSKVLLERYARIRPTTGQKKGQNTGDLDDSCPSSKKEMEARGGIEPPMMVLQTIALPLGDRAPGEGLVRRRGREFILRRPVPCYALQGKAMSALGPSNRRNRKPCL